MSSPFDNSGFRVLVGFVGFVIAGSALVCCAMGMVAEFQDPGLENLAGTVGISGCLAVTALVGVGLSWFGFKGASEDGGIPVQAENQLLNLAKQSEGRLTAAEAAAHTDLTLAQTEALLTELSERGLIRLEVDTGGDEVYVFPGLGPDDATFDEQQFEAELASAIEDNEALPE